MQEQSSVAASLSRPRVKPEHRPYRTVDGHVRIGSVVHGIGAEIADPEGWVWALTQAMDGYRSPQQIAVEVAQAHATPNVADVLQAITDLSQAGFLEDAATELPEAFSAREGIRYGRGVALLRWMDLSARANSWDLQLALSRAKVLLIGLSGAGEAAAHRACLETSTPWIDGATRGHWSVQAYTDQGRAVAWSATEPRRPNPAI